MLKMAKMVTILSVAAAIAVGNAPAGGVAKAALMMGSKDFSVFALRDKVIANFQAASDAFDHHE